MNLKTKEILIKAITQTKRAKTKLPPFCFIAFCFIAFYFIVFYQAVNLRIYFDRCNQMKYQHPHILFSLSDYL